MLTKAILNGYPSQRRFGGGVTFSGGEPVLYPIYARQAADLCRSYGLHTVLHTGGNVPREDLLTTAQGFDMILFDLKAWSVALHERMTGVPNIRILSNLRYLCLNGGNIHVRITVVQGVNDPERETSGMADLLGSLPNIGSVQLKPYDPVAAGGCTLIGGDIQFNTPSRPNDGCMEAFARPFKDRGIYVQILNPVPFFAPPAAHWMVYR
jgi:pyruvate formate lyase activating enzyme